ncbi:MAG: hypothetical protein KBD23_06380, partial [Gammaproteobacteria bacterium]|nr:hypothetical protein [Gammaproteobacteria bacterium]
SFYHLLSLKTRNYSCENRFLIGFIIFGLERTPYGNECGYAEYATKKGIVSVIIHYKNSCF